MINDKDVQKSFLDVVNSDVSKRNFVNSMAIMKKFFRPNNYRRQIRVKSVDTTIMVNNGFLVDTTIRAKFVSHTKLVFIYFSDNITIQLSSKGTLTVIWSQDQYRSGSKVDKKWFLIEGSSKEELNSFVRAKKVEIVSLMDDALRFVIKSLGLLVESGISWQRKEDGFKGDKFIDKLPRDAVIHESNWKKVYQERSIEVTEGLGVDEDFIINYVNNSLLEDFTPELVKEFNRLHCDIRALSGDIGVWCEENLLSLQDVLNHERIIKYIPDPAKKLFISNFLFDRFGGVK